MQPRSSSAHVNVTAYAAGPPGSGEGSGFAVDAGGDAVSAVLEQFGVPPHLEPLPSRPELDGKPFWLREPGDPPLRRRYRRRPQDRLPKQAKQAPRPVIRFHGPALEVARLKREFAARACPSAAVPRPRTRTRRVASRRPVRRSSGSRGDPPPGEPEQVPASRAAVHNPGQRPHRRLLIHTNEAPV